VLNYDALRTGLAFLPATVIMGALSLNYSHKLVMRFGTKATLVPALGLIAVALLLFTLAPVEGDYVTHVLPVTVLLGIGAGLAFPALMTLAMSGVQAGEAGLASGLVNTTAQVGGALGLALLATLASTRSGDLTAAGEPLEAALNGGYHLAFTIGALLVAAAIVVGLVVLESETSADPGASPAPGPAPHVCAEAA
jgi:MFS family permease